MGFIEHLNFLLSEYNIPNAVPVRLSDCRVIRKHKLDTCGFCSQDNLTACVFTVPYFVDDAERNISSYAVSKDYHLFFSQIWDSILPKLSDRYKGYRFVGFADNSPIDEVHAAALAGLGCIGKNNLLITKEYSSYIFIGEIITDLPIDDAVMCEVRECEGCGLCQRACPKSKLNVCLSELTQKKGELTQNENALIKEFKCAWGCDICQEVCPHTVSAIQNGTIYTNIDFFKQDRTPVISSELIEGMDDAEFSMRAYSWRKRATVLRNLKLIEQPKKGEQV